MSENGTDRRSFLGGAAMIGGLAAGYGTFFSYAGRYLYPAKDEARAWMFVATEADVAAGASLTYRTPTGHSVVITRRGAAGGVGDFIALSSTCPHLGCQVHWEQANNRFFCPCHNGVFTPEGTGIGGPPGDAGQSLPRYPLKIENGLLYIEVPVERVAAAPATGRDPCLGEA